MSVDDGILPGERIMFGTNLLERRRLSYNYDDYDKDENFCTCICIRVKYTFRIFENWTNGLF